MKKKTIILLLVLSIVFIFCACTPPRGELTVTSPQIAKETNTAALPTKDPVIIQATPSPTKDTTQEVSAEPEPTKEIDTKEIDTKEIDTKDSDLTKELDSTLDEVDKLLKEIDEILAMDID